MSSHERLKAFSAVYFAAAVIVAFFGGMAAPANAGIISTMYAIGVVTIASGLVGAGFLARVNAARAGQ